MKKWTAVQYDVSKNLSAVALQRVKVPQGLGMSLIIELEDEAYTHLAKDPVWIHRMQEAANAKAQPVLLSMRASLKKADDRAVAFDVKTAQIFSNDINAFIKKTMETAGADMAKEVDHLFETYKKGQKDLLKFRVKSGAKITTNAVVIVGAVAVTGATHGAFAPAGIVAIARGGIIITQECAKLATTADQIAKLIQGELAILKKIMIEDLEKAKKLGKVSQSVKEIGLGVISATLGIETPSLKNCQGHIAVHKVDIAKLDAESHELAKTIHHAMDTQAAWEVKFDKAKGAMPEKKVTKIKVDRDKARKTLHNLLEATFKVNEAINRANKRQELFEKTLDAMMKGMPEWVGYVQTATNLAIDIGLAVGGAGTALEQGLAALIALEVDIVAEL